MELRMQIIYIKWYVEKFLKICKWRIFELHTKHKFLFLYFPCVQMQRGESDASPRDQRQERGLELARPRPPRTHGEWLPHPRRLQRWPSIRNTLWISPWGCFQPVTSKFHNICTSIKIYFLGVKNSCSIEIRLIHQKTAMKRIIMNMNICAILPLTLWSENCQIFTFLIFNFHKGRQFWRVDCPRGRTVPHSEETTCTLVLSAYLRTALQHCSTAVVCGPHFTVCLHHYTALHRNLDTRWSCHPLLFFLVFFLYFLII